MISKNTTFVNYFLYARKSTDVEDKQILSIEGQLSELRILAAKEGLEVKDEFVEKQSAKAPGRPVFGEMLARIERGEAQGIVCWKLDRLARNPVDGGQISWFLQRGIIQHIQTYERSYRPADNVMMMSVELGMANQYIRDLSTNTKRGLREKVRRGEYPSFAPLGYINDLRSKRVAVDPQKAKIVKAAFELYAKDQSRLEDISTFFKQQGVVSKKGTALKRDRVSHILSDPFYYGLFRYAGELHEGKHETIISKQLFDKVREVLEYRGRPHENIKNHPQILCGLFHCGECGRSITAETKTKHQKNGNIHHYVYYRCTKKNVKCSQPHIRSEALESQLAELLKPYVLPPEWADGLLKLADKDTKESALSVAAVAQDLRSRTQEIDRKLERLLKVYLDEDIEPERYRQEKNNLTSEKKTLTEQVTRLEQRRGVWLAPLRNWIKDAEKLGEITLSPELHPKKSFAQKIFGSHLFLKNQKIESAPQPQWAAVQAAREKIGKIPLSCILVWLHNEGRTHFIKNS
jgi:DNA invertase Pin-like site-specific DNA recombinase